MADEMQNTRTNTSFTSELSARLVSLCFSEGTIHSTGTFNPNIIRFEAWGFAFLDIGIRIRIVRITFFAKLCKFTDI